MMVVFDTTFLLHLIDPHILPPLDTNTGEPVTNAYRRVTHLVNDLHRSREKIIVPTPALAELLILAERAGADYLDSFTRAAVFQVEAFDVRAAVELSIMTAKALEAGDKRAGSTASMAKIKFDRQIVAIARANGAAAIYTNDANLTRFASKQHIDTVALWDLTLPPEDRQLDFLADVEMAEAVELEPETDDENEESEGGEKSD